MADERWKYVVFNKSITEEESLDFYTTWAKDVSKPYRKHTNWAHKVFFSVRNRRREWNKHSSWNIWQKQ